ncbi:MAG: hypothetical protein Q9199_002288 [Rusavskia elegans]
MDADFRACINALNGSGLDGSVLTVHRDLNAVRFVDATIKDATKCLMMDDLYNCLCMKTLYEKQCREIADNKALASRKRKVRQLKRKEDQRIQEEQKRRADEAEQYGHSILQEATSRDTGSLGGPGDMTALENTIWKHEEVEGDLLSIPEAKKRKIDQVGREWDMRIWEAGTTRPDDMGGEGNTNAQGARNDIPDEAKRGTGAPTIRWEQW